MIGKFLVDEDGRGLLGFRLNAPAKTLTMVAVNNEIVNVSLPSFDDVEAGDHGATVITLSGKTFNVQPADVRGTGHHHAHDGDILSPMPGKVIAVDVAKGDRVTAGQRLMVLEAMKMEHALTAPFDGTVTEINASEGAQVQVEALLARIENAED